VIDSPGPGDERFLSTLEAMKTLRILCICFAALAICSCNNSAKQEKSDKQPVDSFTATLKEQPIGKEKLHISLPADYSIRQKGGADFMVYYFDRADSTIKSDFSGGLYIGSAPSEFPPTDLTCQSSKIERMILQSLAVWRVYNCGDSSFFAQTVLDNTSGKEGSKKLHAFGKGKSQADLDKMMKIFATLTEK
jgi:hypothetical protein